MERENLFINERYHILKASAAGGMGEIFAGMDLHLGIRVAIKVIPLAYGNAWELERDIHRKLTDPIFPRLLDAFCDSQYGYLVMEWIDGLNLEQWIRQDKNRDQELLENLTRQLLEIMNNLHSQKPAVIFQDLKPANLLLSLSGKLYLIDFGMAFEKTYGKQSVKKGGTRGYAAAEQMSGVLCVDEQSDIYSIGAVLYSLYTGILLNYPPYEPGDIRNGYPEIPDSMKYIIEKSLAKEKEERFSSVEEILFYLQESKKNQSRTYRSFCNQKKGKIFSGKNTGLYCTKSLFLCAHPYPGMEIEKNHLE